MLTLVQMEGSQIPEKRNIKLEPVKGDVEDDVLFGSIYGVRTIELNRPHKLNSLDGSMARKIVPRLRVCYSKQI
jgi:enoyl-CoA hydratase/carnithine racemase